MRFGPVPIDAAVGQVLGHNVSDASGRRALRKGRPLSAEDVERLRGLGKRSVYVAQLEAGDVAEDVAAGRLAARLAGPGLRHTAARTGRVNFHAERLGVLRVDAGRLRAINGAPGIALATLRGDGAVRTDAITATLKIVPFAVPGAIVGALEESLETAGPILTLDPIEPSRVGVILSGAPTAENRIRRGYLPALGQRAAVGEREPEAQQVALALGRGMVLEGGAGVVGDVVVDELDVARREHHFERKSRLVGDLDQEVQRLALDAGHRRRAGVPFGVEDAGIDQPAREPSVGAAEDGLGVVGRLARGLLALPAPPEGTV